MWVVSSVAPWVFLLAPLAGMLVVSRPARRREWIALAIAAPLLVLALAPAGGLFEQYIRAAGMLFSGGFIVAMLWRPGPVLGRALAGAAAAATILLLLGDRFGARWIDVQHAAARDTRTYFQEQAVALRSTSVQGLDQLPTQLADSADVVATLYPAILVLVALAGVACAWRLYGRVVTDPIGPPAGSFAEFRFDDHLLWVPVVALAALLLLPARLAGAVSIPVVARNVLLVCVPLYALRGLAVFWSVARRAPRGIVVALGLVALILFPFVVSGLTLIGVADSRLDFRRRLPPTPFGGMKP